MEFCIQANNGKIGKRIVPATQAIVAGIWNEIDKRLEKPCAYTIRQMIPYRYRKAFDRQGGNFWFDDSNRWNGQKVTGNIPYLTLYDCRGKYLCNLLAFPVQLAGESVV